MNADLIEKYLDELYPNAHCELNYNSIFSLLIAVMLSAQTTDKSVNEVTPILFNKYKTINDLAEAKLNDVEKIIKQIGLYKNKAKNIIETAKIIHSKYNDVVPNSMEELTKLPGVGRKTASVVLIEGFKIPAFPVDTHVSRVSQRLGLSKSGSKPEQIEKDLKNIFKESKWGKLHHQMIFFGRYKCRAIKPLCDDCNLKSICKK